MKRKIIEALVVGAFISAVVVGASGVIGILVGLAVLIWRSVMGGAA